MRRLRPVIVVLAALVSLTACSGDPSPTGDGGAAAASPAKGKALRIPDVQLTDVANGAKVSLQSQIATDRPTLLWAWAPY